MSDRLLLRGWWTKLGQSQFEHPAIEVTDSPIPGVLVGQTPAGLRQVLIPVGRVVIVDESLGTREILVQNTSYSTGSGDLTPYAAVSCASSDLHGAFDVFIEHLLDELAKGGPVGVALQQALDELRRLIQLPGEIGRETLIGALGELLVLKQLAGISPSAANSWKGWQGGRHDFVAGLNGIEVKSSGRLDSAHVTIHGVAQLNPAEGGQLWLHHCKFEESSGNEQALISIQRLVDGLASAGISKTVLLERLKKIGVEPDSKGWKQVFQFAGCETYEVKPGFPRIQPGAIPESASRKIDQLQYRVNLGEADTFRLSESERETHLREFMETPK